MTAAEAVIEGARTPRRAAVPLSVYVHLPWCVKKCPYCDFNSHRAPSVLPETAYVDALRADWAAARAGEPRAVATVFFGGGTPSLFSASAIGQILEALAAGPGLAANCEITLEANPGTTERTRFAELRAAGVNRLSLGVQSLDNACLRALGRVHDAGQAQAAIADARAAGFAALNCDLMFGLPGQTLTGAVRDVDRLIAQNPDHISYYQLTLEPGTPFYKHPPARPDEELTADIFAAGRERLVAAGYRQYEVSAWARDGAICRHNDNYWRFGDYIGIGAGAHSKRTRADGAIERSARVRWPAGYMQTAGGPQAIAKTRILDAEDARFECLLNALRRKEGLTRADYAARTGLDWSALLAHLRPSISAGRVIAGGECVRASDRGWDFLDTILADLLP